MSSASVRRRWRARCAALAAGVIVSAAFAPANAAAIAVSVDFNQDRHSINPEVYGVNFGTDAQAQDLRFPLRRYGGNSTSRHNWESDVHNTAFDYFFENIPDSADAPYTDSTDQFIGRTRLDGGQPLMTLNTLGYVPLDPRIGGVPKTRGFSIVKYGLQDQNECDVCYGNASCLLYSTSPRPASTTSPATTRPTPPRP